MGSFSQGVTITHLTNQRVLIASRQTKISIDGLFKQEFDYLDALNAEQQLKTQSATAPQLSSIKKIFPDAIICNKQFEKLEL